MSNFTFTLEEKLVMISAALIEFNAIFFLINKKKSTVSVIWLQLFANLWGVIAFGISMKYGLPTVPPILPGNFLASLVAGTTVLVAIYVFYFFDSRFERQES